MCSSEQIQLLYFREGGALAKLSGSKLISSEHFLNFIYILAIFNPEGKFLGTNDLFVMSIKRSLSSTSQNFSSFEMLS